MHDALIPSDEVDDFIVLRARAFTSKVRRAMIRDVLSEEGIPLIEWQLIFSVARFGTCHLAYITRHTSLDPAHGSRAAMALEKKALIERHDDPNNRRRKLISLTSEGAATVHRIWPQARGLVRMVTDTFDRTELEQVKHLFDMLNKAVEVLDAEHIEEIAGRTTKQGAQPLSA